MKLLSLSRLPFRFIEHAEFHHVISYARLAPAQPQIPSAKTMRSRLRGYVEEQQQSILKQLPPGVKLSLALDCWTSPFGQAFMAVTGYFLDQHWEYREILLGFQPLSGSHTGVNLSEVVLKLLRQHKITDRVLAVTTDNASNNKTMISSIQESLQSLELNNGSTIVRVPCIAHVIQLSMNDLLGKMKATPKNEHAEMNWSENRVRSLRVRQQKRKIIDTLNKVRIPDPISPLILTRFYYPRSETLRSISTLVHSGGSHFATFRLKSQSLFQSRMFEPAGTQYF